MHARVRSAAQLNFLHVRAMPQMPPTSDPRKPEISSPKLLVRTSRRISYARTICTHISALAHGMHDSRACNPPLASAKCMNRTSPADNSVQRLVLLFRGAVQNTRLLVIHPSLGRSGNWQTYDMSSGTLKVRLSSCRRRDFHGIISCRITLSDALSEKSLVRCL